MSGPRGADPERTHQGSLPATWRRPVLGVLGGMGPAATVAFLDALVRQTPATRDQEHIDTVVLSHASTPDRTARLVDEAAPDPTPYLMADLELLGRLGVDRAVIACNTSHAFLPPAAELPVPLLSLVQVGAEAAVAAAPVVEGAAPVVTVLATDGTLRSEVYQRALSELGAEVRLPDERGQRAVMALIYDGVKAGAAVTPQDLSALVDQVADPEGAVLLGCTELSVLYDHACTQGEPMPARIADAQDALVRRVLAEFGRPA